jgi:hypothetical protein
MVLRRLYVKCPNCGLVFSSGFQAESATQLIGLLHLCQRCHRIVPCYPSDYLEKVGEDYVRAMKKEELFALPPGKRIEITGPDVYDLTEEVMVKLGAFLSSTGGIVCYRPKGGGSK